VIRSVLASFLSPFHIAYKTTQHIEWTTRAMIEERIGRCLIEHMRIIEKTIERLTIMRIEVGEFGSEACKITPGI
jgi:hypothetical protein